jgi:hypothetical protein
MFGVGGMRFEVLGSRFKERGMRKSITTQRSPAPFPLQGDVESHAID